MVVGARQVGKTYIIEQFCKENFKHYIYINLMENKRIGEIFDANENILDIVKKFKAELKEDITEDTIIFIDEIQESEDLISALKYFCESDFPYKIVCAGSLLGVKLKRFNKSFPVGKVIIEYMYPMNFKEFLMALGKDKHIQLIEECFNLDKAMPEYFHEDLLNDYRNYLCLGGMPKMISKYIENDGNINGGASLILRTIVDSYIADMKRYTNNIYETNKIELMYKSIPNQLAKENKKYQFSKLAKNARFRDYETAYEWLLASRLIVPCYFVNKIEAPLKVYTNDTDFKIYMGDVGLLSLLLGTPYSNIILDESFMFKGAITENYVATELFKNNLDLFYYQKPQVMEIDFLIDTSKGVIPIEVKASDNVKSTSLNKFMKDNKFNFGIRISTKNFGFENNIKSVPLYAVFCIKKES